MIAAIYARKSTEQSGVSDEEKSVSRQIAHAKIYAAKKGWTVAETNEIDRIGPVRGGNCGKNHLAQAGECMADRAVSLTRSLKVHTGAERGASCAKLIWSISLVSA